MSTVRTRSSDESGDTLIEILFALVLIGLIFGAFFTAITTTASASRAHRDYVTADAVLRDYAESTKQAARDKCGTGVANGATFVVGYTAPAGFAVSATGLACPSLTTVNPVVITATLPNGTTKRLGIEVRRP